MLRLIAARVSEGSDASGILFALSVLVVSGLVALALRSSLWLAGLLSRDVEDL